MKPHRWVEIDADGRDALNATHCLNPFPKITDKELSVIAKFTEEKISALMGADIPVKTMWVRCLGCGALIITMKNDSAT